MTPYKFLIGESVLTVVVDSIQKAFISGKAQFKGKAIYELTFSKGGTLLRLESSIESDTLEFIRKEPDSVKVETPAVA